jgi:hypothetical protein
MEDGSVRIVPLKNSAKVLKGFFRVQQKVTSDEMDAAIRKKRSERAGHR